MSDRELQIKIGLARAGLAGDAAAAARTIKANLADLNVDLKIDQKGINLAKKAIDELGDETLQTAKQAEFLKNAYNLNDDEVNKVIARMGQLERSTRDAKKEGGALQEIFTGFLRRVGESAFTGLISAVQRLGQAVANMVSGAVSGFIEFERAVQQAGVISGSIGTEDFEALNDEIKRLGIETSKTPVEIANTAVNLSRAGFAADETAASLEAVARASEATGETMDVTGDIIAKTYRTFQNQFEEAGISAQEASKYIANALVQTANSTNTTITSIGESLAYAGPQAAAANQDLGELLVLIGLLGDTGKQGSAAGTGLAEMLARLKTASAAGASEFGELARGSKRAVEAFNEIGTEVRNTDGTMKGLLEIIPNIKDKLSGLNQIDQDLLTKVLFGVQGEGSLVPLLNVTEERLETVKGLILETAQAGEGAAVVGGEAMLDKLNGALALIDGSIKSFKNNAVEAIAPALEAIVRSANDIFVTLLKTDGLFDPLAESAQRLAIALSGSQEVAGNLTDQVVNFTEVAIDQLASVIDAVTAFISTEGNVTQLAEGFEALVTVLKALATVTNVVIALADGIGSLKSSAEGLPIIGDNIERLLNFPTPLNALTEALRAVGDVMMALKDIVVNAIDGMLERLGQMLPVLNPLITQVQGLLGKIASQPEAAPFVADPDNYIDVGAEPEDNRDRAGRRPTSSGTTPTPTTPPPGAATGTEEAPDFTALDAIANKYAELTTKLETEQANQTRALVEGGKSREEIEAKEREFFQRRIKLNEQKLAELRAIDQSGLKPEDAAKVQAEILNLDRQLAGDRLKVAEDTRKGKEDAARAETKAVEDAAKEQERIAKETEKAREDAARAEEQRRKAAIDNLEAQQRAEEALAQVALESAEVKLAALDRVADGLAQQAGLLEAQANLSQSVADLEASLFEARSESLREVLGDEEATTAQKKKAASELLRLTEEQFAAEKEQLEARQALELQQFDLAQKQAALAEQRGIKEQELALKRLELQRLEIQNEIELARLRGDDAAVQIGEAQLGLLGEQTTAQQEYLASLQEAAAVSAEIGAQQRGALVAGQEQQDIALAQSQRGTAAQLDDQVSGLGRSFDRRGDRLVDRAEGRENRELREARRNLPGLLDAARPNPQLASLGRLPSASGASGLDLSQFVAPVVAEIQALGGAVNALAASPRQLTVQTPDPVADTSAILSDISRMQAAGVNP